MFHVCTYQGVFGDGRFNGTMQNVVGPTLVAMATKVGLVAELLCVSMRKWLTPSSLHGVFNANCSNTVNKDTDFRFDKHVPIDSPDMTP